jgi:hypothetical protein
MVEDLLERLAEADVPPPPRELDRKVHERVNRALFAAQMADLALRGTVWALVQFARPLAHLAVLTLTGKPLEKRRGDEK